MQSFSQTQWTCIKTWCSEWAVLSGTPDWHTWLVHLTVHLTGTPDWYTWPAHLTGTPDWCTWLAYLTGTQPCMYSHQLQRLQWVCCLATAFLKSLPLCLSVCLSVCPARTGDQVGRARSWEKYWMEWHLGVEHIEIKLSSPVHLWCPAFTSEPGQMESPGGRQVQVWQARNHETYPLKLPPGSEQVYLETQWGAHRDGEEAGGRRKICS